MDRMPFAMQKAKAANSRSATSCFAQIIPDQRSAVEYGGSFYTAAKKLLRLFGPPKPGGYHTKPSAGAE
jgi:hypothetical protein